MSKPGRAARSLPSAGSSRPTGGSLQGLHKLVKLKRDAFAPAPPERWRVDELAALEARFSWALNLLWMAFQPIVAWHDRRIFGYEALVRSSEPLMRDPAELLDAAERLGRVHELGRTIRALIAKAASDAPERFKLFVNLHSFDLNDEDLYAATAPLSRIAHRVVLEVTERASLDAVSDVASRVRQLKSMGFQIAIDDLGAGYAGLARFAELEPDVAKLDMSLVRGIDTDARKQSIVRSMTTLGKELGARIVAEGVETAAERDVLVGLGNDLLQGNLFARPTKGFIAPGW
jgi:EAL domain-containing protein (putative c-di-GMP-specific phosphodiesterase class I)